MRFSDLPREGVTIWGLGREGRAVLRKCHELGIRPAVAVPEPVPGAVPDAGPTAYDDPPVLHGEDARLALLASDVVVKSPGVPVTSDLYRTVAAAARVTSLTDLWLADNRERTVAVTGTKGKSTTASLVHHLLGAHGHPTSLLGNIGTPLLDEPEPHGDTAVVELSSYQTQSVTTSPRMVVFTSLFPEHLGWHGSEEAYVDDKLHLADYGPDLVVCPRPDEHLTGLVRRRLPASTRLVVTDPTGAHVDGNGDLRGAGGTVPAERLPVRGAHNVQNVALAVRVVEELGLVDLDWHELGAVLAAFHPLPHRMEQVPSTDARTWIDDGLATAPEAVVAALRSLGERRISLVLGGADRGLVYDGLLTHLETRTEDLVLLLIGPAGARIGARIADGSRPAPAHEWFPSLEAACAWARGAENDTDVVLLSPGAPSFDEFTDYRARSALFRRMAQAGP